MGKKLKDSSSMYFSEYGYLGLTGLFSRKIARTTTTPSNPPQLPNNPLATTLPPITPYTYTTKHQQQQHLAIFLENNPVNPRYPFSEKYTLLLNNKIDKQGEANGRAAVPAPHL